MSKIADGLKDAIANVERDKAINRAFRDIANVLAADPTATWYELSATVCYGKKRRRLTMRGGPPYFHSTAV